MDLRKRLLQNLKKTYCRIARSKTSGVGVIAIREIKKGINPFPLVSRPKWLELNVSEMKCIDKQVLKMVFDFFAVEKNGAVELPEFGLNGMDITFFLNHSAKPNVVRLRNGNFRALRKIRAGEELLVDYGSFDKNFRL